MTIALSSLCRSLLIAVLILRETNLKEDDWLINFVAYDNSLM
jgi:hypothetical protein